MWFHVTSKNFGDSVIFHPRIPKSAGGCLKTGLQEDTTVPRICFAPSVEKCLIAIKGLSLLKNILLEIVNYRQVYYVYGISKKYKVYKPTKEQVFDVGETEEVWRLKSAKLNLVGIIDSNVSKKLGKVVVTWL